MVSRKRAAEEADVEEAQAEPSLLHQIRNTWQFAALMQYIYLFGSAVKIDDNIDVEDLEEECIQPTHSQKLSEVGLALLKYVSSHKGLTLEIFDEYTRRQYVAKAPERNPFGTEDEPRKFAEFDIFTKLRVLHQLSTWTLGNPDRIREKMGDKDGTSWRIEPLGWDEDDRTYFVLDDNRLYRRTDAPLPPAPKAKPKSKSKKRRSIRSSKRRRVSERPEESGDDEADETMNEDHPISSVEDDGFGGMKWECLAITLDEYQSFMESIRKTRDHNQKVLYDRLRKEVLPSIHARAEELERKRLKQLRDLENIEKLATAKRSSRLAGKQEKRKEQEAVEEAERKRLADLVMARKEMERQQKREQDRESRMMTREQRVKEREVKRILMEEEVAKLAEQEKQVESQEARLSERHLKAEMQKRKEELEKLSQEEDWIFDCSVCGVHGENLDDGTHSIACEKCNVWQHSACHKIKQSEAERDDFHFVCKDCTKKEAQAKLSLKLRLNPPPQANNPELGPRSLKSVEIPPLRHEQTHIRPPSSSGSVLNGPSLSPQGQGIGPPGAYQHIARGGGHMLPPNSSSPVPPQYHPSSASPSMPGTTTYSFPKFASTTHGTSVAYSGGQHASKALPNGAGPVHQPTEYRQLEYQNHSMYRSHFLQSSDAQTQGPGHHVIAHDPFINAFQPIPNYVYKVPSVPAPATPSTNGQSRSPAILPPSITPRPISQERASSPSKSFTTPIQRTPVQQQPLLPNVSAGLSPEKHDFPRPASSNSNGTAPQLLPAPSLSPTASQRILTPPVKNPTPERPSLFGPPPQMMLDGNSTQNGGQGT